MSDSGSDPWDDTFDDANDDHSSDDDPFTFQKVKFRKKRPGLDEESPGTAKRGRTRCNMSVSDKALEKLERRQEKTSLKHHMERAAQKNTDDDSDIEVLEERKGTETKPKQEDLLELSSDDEVAGGINEQFHRPRFAGSTDVSIKLVEAQRARSQLSAAQHYHAEDVYVPEPVVNVDSPGVSFAGIAFAPARSSAPLTNLGPTFRLQVRTSQIVQGKRNVVSSDAMRIRQREPFQKLLERYRAERGVASYTRVTLSFDGERVGLNTTPAALDMEDDDLIDVIVEGSLGVVGVSAAPARSLGATLALRLRTREVGKTQAVTQDVFRIREQEPLQKLFDKYRKDKKAGSSARVRFEFDGEAMDPQKTPKSYEMEDEDIIEVIMSR